MDRLKVLILFGGMAEEHDISIKSASQLANWLDGAKYEASYVYITREGAWLWGKTREAAMNSATRASLSADRGRPGLLRFDGDNAAFERVDAVFPMLHGRMGEDGAIQGLMELAGISYVGCGVAASAMGMDKSLAYLAAARAGVAVPKHRLIEKGEETTAGEIDYPLFVKPARSGSSFGVSKVYLASALGDAVRDARRYDDKILLEEAIEGSEIGVAVLGEGENIVVGEPDQIELSGGFFRIHQEKQPEKGSENSVVRVPANIAAKERAAVIDAAKRVYQALGCRGLARVDLFLRPDGGVTLNEVNTMPGFTSYSRYPRMMAAAGYSMTEVVSRLIDMAVAKGEGA